MPERTPTTRTTPTTARHRVLPLALAAVAALGLAGCGDDDGTEVSSGGQTTTTPAATSSTAGATSTSAPESPTTTSGSEPSTTSTPSSTTPPDSLAQPAIWPASDVVFATPEEAAKDFMTTVFGFAPKLGEFQSGDSRSGEIEVFIPDEEGQVGGGPAVARSTLLLRKLAPTDGWFVLAAINPNTTITTPESGSEVVAGNLTVKGMGRGFEGLIVVEAFKVGSGTALSQQTAQGGSMETSEPYQVTLDLSGASTGDRLLLLARGGVGLETDPGEFSAIPVTIGAGAPATSTTPGTGTTPPTSGAPGTPGSTPEMTG